jgi:hypothetical protein
MKIGYVSTHLPQRCGIATYRDYLMHSIGVFRHLHLLPILERGNKDLALILPPVTHIQHWHDLFEGIKGSLEVFPSCQRQGIVLYFSVFKGSSILSKEALVYDIIQEVFTERHR